MKLTILQLLHKENGNFCVRVHVVEAVQFRFYFHAILQHNRLNS